MIPGDKKRIYARSYAVRSKTPAGCGGLPNGIIPLTPESLELGIGGLEGWRLEIGDRGSGVKPEHADREQADKQTGNREQLLLEGWKLLTGNSVPSPNSKVLTI